MPAAPHLRLDPLVRSQAFLASVLACGVLAACGSSTTLPDAGSDSGVWLSDSGPPADSGPAPHDAGPPDPCAACGGATPLCDPFWLRCVGCLTSEHCGSAYCDPGTQRCVRCTTNDECENPALPRCSETGACVTDSAIAIELGELHACAVTTHGSVRCWGANFSSQLGDGTDINRDHPVEVRGLADVVAVTSGGGTWGGGHSCALTGTGGVKCWGSNATGQLGDGTTTSRPEPVDVVGLANGVVALSAGAWHTCALLGSGAVRCWGDNAEGQLGDGGTDGSSVPVEVLGLPEIAEISAGGHHTCARSIAGAVWCWGYNGYGQLGDGTTTTRATPVSVAAWTDVTSVSAGGSHTCVRLSGGAMCTGSNRFGQLGSGWGVSVQTSPVAVTGLARPLTISAGREHTCTVSGSSGAQCWGHNEFGALGADTMVESRGVPVDVVDLGGAVAVEAGDGFSCALLGTGSIRCWGSNRYGELGATGSSSRVPVDVVGF